jgi:uridylate kinase
MAKKTVLIKFGGSIMTPDLPDIEYIKQFKKFVEKLNSKYRFILITGGGGINKKYNDIAKNINAKATNRNLDWIGIQATRLNAMLLITVFGDKCYKNVVKDPTRKINWKEDILVGAGWKPGWSTDYDSMILAKRLKADKIIIATNTDHVYDKDPNKYSDAKPLDQMNWEDLEQMVGDKWTPRMHIPLDPSAIQYGKKYQMQVLSLNGRNLSNMEKAIKDEKFVGTVIG